MKLYHYAPKDNTILKEGIYSFSKHPSKGYVRQAGSDNLNDIISWMDTTFPGRSRSISCLTERIPEDITDFKLRRLKKDVLFSFELDDLTKDGIVESIWCKDGEVEDTHQEIFYQVKPSEIDASPLAWDKVDTKNEKCFSVIRHYMIVVKDGVIPPKYLKLEKNHSKLYLWLSRIFKK